LKKVSRFYISPESFTAGLECQLDDRQSRHALAVLRLKRGDEIGIFDGHGREGSGTITETLGGKVRIRLTGAQAALSPSASIQVTLGVSVIKPERMDYLIQRVAELGVSHIAPLISQRTIVRISPNRWESKVLRWRKIALEACKQCGRSRAPQIAPVVSYNDFISSVLGSYDKILIPTLSVPSDILYQTLKETPRPGKVLALIGPEGDFSEEEVRVAMAQGAQAVSLGPLVLRSETAAIYLLSVMNFFYREVSL
jgi:16S rRNA (uracil1498-N3)-methyltransferase